jgi:hypothetical protein
MMQARGGFVGLASFINSFCRQRIAAHIISCTVNFLKPLSLQYQAISHQVAFDAQTLNIPVHVVGLSNTAFSRLRGLSHSLGNLNCFYYPLSI